MHPQKVERFLVYFFLLFIKTENAPLPQQKFPSKEMERFMQNYGYLESGASADTLYSEEGFRSAIRSMQRFGGLPETGELDEETLNLTRTPRCGVPDILKHGSVRAKRFVIGSEGWKKRTISYHLPNWAPEMGPELTSSKLAEAFDLWSRVTPLRFVSVNGTEYRAPDVDLIVGFVQGDHMDGYPFDGPSNVLAHAFFPYEHGTYGGDIHFDGDERWIDATTMKVVSGQEGVDFFTVASHEIGHSLGLGHSTVSGSIMFPYYKGYSAYMTLDYDDVYAMYSMYYLNADFQDESSSYPITPTVESVTTPDEDESFKGNEDDSFKEEESTVPSEGEDDNSENSNVDSKDDDNSEDIDDSPQNAGNDSTTVHDDHIVCPNGKDSRSNGSCESSDDSHPDFSADSHEDEYSPETDDTYDGKDGLLGKEDHLPDNNSNETDIVKKPSLCDGSIDAAALFRSELFLFKGRFMWRLNDRNTIREGYPVEFHKFFDRIPNAIHAIYAVYHRESDSYIIFFTGQFYWIFDGDRFTLDSPSPLSDLGLPSDLDKLDSAFVWAKNRKTYFFRGDQYWRYNEMDGRVESGYPQSIVGRWKGLESDIDTAFTWRNGKTYFFKRNYYWRFGNKKVQVDDNYPRPVASNWFGCQEL